MNESNRNSKKGAPSKLHFDDGSRIMMEGENSIDSSVSSCTLVTSTRDKNVPIELFYEIDRVSSAILSKPEVRARISEYKNNEKITLKIALQFPDELLPDAPDVCFALEEVITSKVIRSSIHSTIIYDDVDALVFLLGDTTNHGSCCVDEVAALHLSADVVVHYGKACLSPTQYLPVVYSFGAHPINPEHLVHCVNQELTREVKEELKSTKFLILYDVTYHHALKNIALMMESMGYNVVLGRIPSEQPTLEFNEKVNTSCCIDSENSEDADVLSKIDSLENTKRCCKQKSLLITDHMQSLNVNGSVEADTQTKNATNLLRNNITIGGLEIMIPNQMHIEDYVLLYIGQEGQQLLNILMRCSGKSGSKACWAYFPSKVVGEDGVLNTNAASLCKRALNRRFFLTQKAKMADVIGIVVGSLANAHYADIVKRLRKCIESAGRTSYTFAVGKINVHKLANFGEIDCYVLVACPETSLLDSRDFHVPIITPFELEIALNYREWDGFYSSEFDDFLRPIDANFEEYIDDEDIDDAPFFNVVSGNYESKAKSHDSGNVMKINAIEGECTNTNIIARKNEQIVVYQSKAAAYLNRREYKGLESNIGDSEVIPAIPGQIGIASDYGKR